LGNETYILLQCERQSTFGSSSWAYHKKEPIPPYVEMSPAPAAAAALVKEEQEYQTIKYILAEI
jgi:hypothetical protein